LTKQNNIEGVNKLTLENSNPKDKIPPDTWYGLMSWPPDIGILSP